MSARESRESKPSRLEISIRGARSRRSLATKLARPRNSERNREREGEREKRRRVNCARSVG